MYEESERNCLEVWNFVEILSMFSQCLELKGFKVISERMCWIFVEKQCGKGSCMSWMDVGIVRFERASRVQWDLYCEV